MAAPSPSPATPAYTFALSFQSPDGSTASTPPQDCTAVSPMFQCAESKVYACDFYGAPAVCKHRFPKAYRHPALDKKLREQRTLREARALARCHKAGIRVPVVYGVEKRACKLYLERIPGTTVKDALDALQAEQATAKGVPAGTPGGGSADEVPPPPPEVARLLRGIGEVVGQLHSINVIHGDLTTSNFMTMDGGNTTSGPASREPRMDRDGLVAIDFGLVTDRNSPEDRAVDLYVLERAVASTHPLYERHAAHIILEGYRHTMDERRGKATLARLEAVRARGRKRSMLG